MLKWWMPPTQERAGAKSPSLPYHKTSQDGNYHHHDPHPHRPYHCLLCPTQRPLRESGRGRRVGDRHRTYHVSSHPSPSSGPPSSPNRFLSPRPASHPPPRSSFHPKSSQPRPSPECRPPTRPTIQPSSRTLFPTSPQRPSGTCPRRSGNRARRWIPRRPSSPSRRSNPRSSARTITYSLTRPLRTQMPRTPPATA